MDPYDSVGSIRRGSIVLVHLTNPREKFWGILDALSPTGVTLKGINVSSFDDWMVQAALKKPQSLGLATMFVPMLRVERIFLDERVGEVESYRQRFEARVGLSVLAYVGTEERDEPGG